MEKIDAFRNLLLYALTQNIGMITDPERHDSIGKILIGNTDIRMIDPECKISIIYRSLLFISFCGDDPQLLLKWNLKG